MPWRISASENMVALPSIDLSSGAYTTLLPARNITTFVQD